MVKPEMVSVIIPAAGNASRMRGIDKIKYELGGLPVLVHTVRLFDLPDVVGEIIVAVKEAEQPEIEKLLAQYSFNVPVLLASGGSSRQESVQNALRTANPRFGYVAVHDAARPLCDQADIRGVFAAAFAAGAAALGVPVKDTVKEAKDGLIAATLPRDCLVAIQTPQVFEKGLYQRGVEKAALEGAEYTDDCQLIEALPAPVAVVKGSERNLKLTTPFDLTVAQAILKNEQEEQREMKSSIRIGHGYDVHRLKEGRKLIIGGVCIPYEKGLDGHSDADVLVHAVMDAMLGALALGDIGTHFLDTDEQYRGADSLALLKQTAALIDQRGYRLGNIDATVLAQAPKLAPHILKMRENIAAVCGVKPAQISVKATTEERLGFTGSGEGVAAHAVCLLYQK